MKVCSKYAHETFLQGKASAIEERRQAFIEGLDEHYEKVVL